MNSEREPTVEAQGIGRRRVGDQGWLFRQVNLTVRPGDRVAILGPSGAGKTVLLRALALLDPLDEGEILWKGCAVLGEAVPHYRRQVLYLHQRPTLFDGSVEANLRLPFALKVHCATQYDEARVIDFLEAFGRDRSFLEKSQGDLSGGEAQLVALIRALQLDPVVLLLDEPTSSLDGNTARAVETLLGQWHAQGSGSRSLVWVTHDADQAQRVSDRRVMVDSGRFEAL